MISRMFQISLSTSDDCSLAVHFQRDGPVLDDLPGIGDGAAHRRLLHVLAQVPGAAFVARHQLQVAPGHIEPGGVAMQITVWASSTLTRKPGLPMATTSSISEVVILRLGRVGHRGARGRQRLRRLGEAERASTDLSTGLPISTACMVGCGPTKQAVDGKRSSRPWMGKVLGWRAGKGR